MLRVRPIPNNVLILRIGALLSCRGRQRNAQSDLCRTWTAIVLLIKPFVCWRSRCCCHNVLLTLSVSSSRRHQISGWRLSRLLWMSSPLTRQSQPKFHAIPYIRIPGLKLILFHSFVHSWEAIFVQFSLTFIDHIVITSYVNKSERLRFKHAETHTHVHYTHMTITWVNA